MDFFKNSKILYTIVALVIALIAVFTNNSPISSFSKDEKIQARHRTLHQATNAQLRLKATGYLPAKNLSYKKEMINMDIATLSRICKNQEQTITMVKANSANT